MTGRAEAIGSGHVTTRDGVHLHYLESGPTSAPPLVILPGWSLPAAEFRPQLEDLGDAFRCVALDQRGHGESDKPAHGYRVARLAMDLREVLRGLGLRDVVLLGHSAGCAVIWSYLELFGEDGIRALVLFDQMVARIRRPEWSEAECRRYGASVGGDEVLAAAAEVGGPDGEAVSRGFLAGMFTPSFPAADLERLITGSLKMPRPYAAQLMLDVSHADYRDVLPRITRPTLCMGGAASHLGPDVMPWIASQIPGARLVMIPADAGGSHFAFLENPAAFDAAVREFCGGL